MSKIPTDKYIGLAVLDEKGRLVGTVKKVASKRNKVTSIEVHKGLKKFTISSSDIQEISEGVILKPSYKTGEIEKEEKTQ